MLPIRSLSKPKWQMLSAEACKYSNIQSQAWFVFHFSYKFNVEKMLSNNRQWHLESKISVFSALDRINSFRNYFDMELTLFFLYICSPISIITYTSILQSFHSRFAPALCIFGRNYFCWDKKLKVDTSKIQSLRRRLFKPCCRTQPAGLSVHCIATDNHYSWMNTFSREIL